MRSSEVRRYGPALNDKWILWAHDIFGVDSGRTKEYCNKMWTGAVQWPGVIQFLYKRAADLGVTCILPDFFRGESWPRPAPTWESQLRADWELKLLPYLLERGARGVAGIGTCFGSYVVMHTQVATVDSVGW